jgi:hypothetical protein
MSEAWDIIARAIAKLDDQLKEPLIECFDA